MALQFDGHRGVPVHDVRITLEGSCEAWGDLVQTGECVTYDASHTPWMQDGG
jgi:hypothetical protein